jgi:4a-hydroxytetrahydrobiopterin dehydratase
MSNDLTKKHCVPCEGGDPPLPDEKEDELLKQVQDWSLLRDGTHMLRKQFKFKNFKESMAFVNKVADLAEGEGHHPDIKIVWNKVNLDLFTHAVGGLSENDFIMAAKINKLG